MWYIYYTPHPGIYCNIYTDIYIYPRNKRNLRGACQQVINDRKQCRMVGVANGLMRWWWGPYVCLDAEQLDPSCALAVAKTYLAVTRARAHCEQKPIKTLTQNEIPPLLLVIYLDVAKQIACSSSSCCYRCCRHPRLPPTCASPTLPTMCACTL